MGFASRALPTLSWKRSSGGGCTIRVMYSLPRCTKTMENSLAPTREAQKGPARAFDGREWKESPEIRN